MRTSGSVSLADLEPYIRSQEGVVTHKELTKRGASLSSVTYQIRPDGPWQRIYPGVVITHRGTPTTRERILAALKYAGPGSMISGITALRLQAVRDLPKDERIITLVRHTRHRSSYDKTVIRRSGRLPKPRIVQGIPVAPPARAAIDQCRETEKLDDVRVIIAAVVQQGRCRAGDIADEVKDTARQRTALARAVLREIAAGIWSVAEAKARALFLKNGIPLPAWNGWLVTSDGEVIARPDAFWEDVMAALEIDSLAWHLSPASYLRTQRRQRGMITKNVPVLPASPIDIIDEPQQFLGEVLSFRTEAGRRPMPTDVRFVPQSDDDAA